MEDLFSVSLNMPVDVYYASEIKKHAIQVTQKNFPDTVQIGNVMDYIIAVTAKGEYIVDKDKLDELGKIDLFLCGSPCKNMSLMNITGKSGINGEKSSLFYPCAAIMKYVKPTYFLFENVCSMTNADKAVFNTLLGVMPIHINSALVSAQERNRYYWTNIPNVTIPNDRKIKLSDIIDYGSEREENWSHKKTEFVERKVKSTMYVIKRHFVCLPYSSFFIVIKAKVIRQKSNLIEKRVRENHRSFADIYSAGGRFA